MSDAKERIGHDNLRFSECIDECRMINRMRVKEISNRQFEVVGSSERLALHWCESDGIEIPHVQPSCQNEFDQAVGELCLRFWSIAHFGVPMWIVTMTDWGYPPDVFGINVGF